MTLYVFDDEDGSVGFNIIDGLFSSPEYTEFKSSSLIPTITKFTLLLLIGSLRLSGEEFTSFNRKGSLYQNFPAHFQLSSASLNLCSHYQLGLIQVYYCFYRY